MIYGNNKILIRVCSQKSNLRTKEDEIMQSLGPHIQIHSSECKRKFKTLTFYSFSHSTEVRKNDVVLNILLHVWGQITNGSSIKNMAIRAATSYFLRKKIDPFNQALRLFVALQKRLG